jgi:hypothetical protein
MCRFVRKKTLAKRATCPLKGGKPFRGGKTQLMSPSPLPVGSRGSHPWLRGLATTWLKVWFWAFDPTQPRR